MYKNLQKAALSLILLLAFASPSFADNFSNGLQQSFDWQTAWGAVNFAGGADPGIPSANLQPKGDIKSIVSDDGTQSANLSSLRVYQLDVNNDGKRDYVIDGNGYFPQFQNPNAPLTICTAADGCFVTIYVSTTDTNLISTPAQNAPQCPATADANTSCIPSCAATEQNCPGSFRYNTITAFDQQVLRWNFISAADYQTWANSANGSYGMSYQIRNASPVFVAQRNNTNCHNEEIMANNNQCVKYYQYDSTSSTFVDLYSYRDASGSTPTPNAQFTYTYAPSDPRYGNGPQTFMGTGLLTDPVTGTHVDGFSHHLVPGQTLDIQLNNFQYTYNDGSTSSQSGYMAFHIVNTSDHDIFVPANSPPDHPNTNPEFCSFVNAMSTTQHSDHDTPPPVQVTMTPPDCPWIPPAPQPPHNHPEPPICEPTPPVQVPHNPDLPPCQEEVHFGPWQGELNCPAMVTAPETIAAQRFCYNKAGDQRSCQECVNYAVELNSLGYVQYDAHGNPLADPTRSQGCSVTQHCEVNACMWSGHGCGFCGPYQPPTGTYTTVDECERQVGIWSYLCSQGHVRDFGGCQNAFNTLCQLGHFCLAGDTLITMADNATKRIDEIKAGDMVLGFKTPKSTLKPFKVKTVAVTPQENLLNVNGGALQLTPKHAIVLKDGKAIPASQLKTGDVLLRGDKTKLTVKSIDTVPSANTVYNLQLEDSGAGFVANGVRVMDYGH
jgi:hypothetical protein